MKKAPFLILIILTLSLVLGTIGFYLFRNLPTAPATVHTTLATQAGMASNPNDPAAMPIDLNSATLEQLMTIPDIGPIYAQRILDYRQEHGPFSEVTDLLGIDGIGRARLESILDYITIGGQHEDSGS